MRIAIATAVYYPMINGVAVFTHNLAVGLAKRGHEVIVLCPSQKKTAYFEKEDGVIVYYLKSTEVKIYPDQIHKVPKKRGLLYKNGFKVSVFPKKEIAEILDKFQPDVVHVQVSDPIGVATVAYARKHQIPVVTTEHNQPEVITEPLHVPKVFKRPIEAALSNYFVRRQGKSDFVTMPTKKAIDDLIWKRGKEFTVPIAAVSNGVDLTNFKPGHAPEQVYQKYGLARNRKIVLYVGRVDPEKKVGNVIEAFLRGIGGASEEVLLVIVGDGVDKNRLERLVKKNGAMEKVKFLGKVLPPDLFELYKVGDVFVTASEIETQGIVLIEAAAAGLPLIAVDKGAVSEVVKDGENGFLCEPGNINEIAAALYKVLTDDKLRQKFSENSIKIAAEHDFEVTLDKFENIYQKVTKSNTNLLK